MVAFLIAAQAAYSYGLVVGALAMVEDPRQRDVSGQTRQSITSYLRTTITHLGASAGRWFWLRGAFFFLSYKMVSSGNVLPPP